MLTLAPKAPPQHGRQVGEILARGLAHHQAGHLAEAEMCYREVLRTEPDHAEALHLLGVIAQQNGDYAQSERLIRSAIGRNPQSADYHNNLGNTCRLQGDLARAVSNYRQAIELDANHIEALHAWRIPSPTAAILPKPKHTSASCFVCNPTSLTLTTISATRS